MKQPCRLAREYSLQGVVYPARALSSPCFLFFRPLIDASSGVRVYGGEMPCSSSPIWAHVARVSSFSPGNTNGGPGLHDCQMRSWATFQACNAIVFPSVRKASFVSSPGRLDLFVKIFLIFFCSTLLRCDLHKKKVPGRTPYSQHIMIRNWT